MAPALQVTAGPSALAHLQKHGLQADDISVMVGASGGPKWLCLAALDQYLFGQFFNNRKHPLNVIGSSSGAWRFACLARHHPAACSRAFAHAYQHICYQAGSSAKDITKRSLTLLDNVLPDESAAADILNHPFIRLHLVVAQARGINRVDNRYLQAMALGVTATANAFSRQALGLFFRRILFHDPRSNAAFLSLTDLPTRAVPLTTDNLRHAVFASGAIPLVLEPVRHIPGAGPGLYYDGGITDYHFDIPFAENNLVLYPHFYSRITPGWFDKALRWRKAHAMHYTNVIVVSPSPDWVASLPLGRIPDRRDFSRMDDATRIRVWGETIRRSTELAEEFEALASGTKPLSRWLNHAT